MRGYYERGNRNRPVQETPRALWPSGSKDEDRDERGGSVDFEQVLKEVLWRLVTEGSISYRRIKRVFGLDDDALDDVRRELIGALHIATDLDGELLVWAADGRAEWQVTRLRDGPLRPCPAPPRWRVRSPPSASMGTLAQSYRLPRFPREKGQTQPLNPPP